MRVTQSVFVSNVEQDISLLPTAPYKFVQGLKRPLHFYFLHRSKSNMCRQYYLACRHRACPNFVKTLRKEQCQQAGCEVTYHRSSKWNLHKGSRYCAACEEMGPAEWTRRRTQIHMQIRVTKRKENAAIKRQVSNEKKARLEKRQKAKKKEKKRPKPRPPCPVEKPVQNAALEPLWSGWCTKFLGNKPNLSETAANLRRSPNTPPATLSSPVQQTPTGMRSISNGAPEVIDLTTADGEGSSPAVSSDGEIQVERKTWCLPHRPSKGS